MRSYLIFVLLVLIFLVAPQDIFARRRVRHDLPPQQSKRWHLNYLCPANEKLYSGYGRLSRDGEHILFQFQPGGVRYRYPIEQCRKI